VLVGLADGAWPSLPSSRVERMNARREQMGRETRRVDDALEYNVSERRPLTPEERRYAEDRQVLEMIAAVGPATLGAVTGSFLGYELTHRREAIPVSTLASRPRRPNRLRPVAPVYVLDWGERDIARRARVRAIIERLRAAGLARVASRRWVITRAGYDLIGWLRWDHHRRQVARRLAGR
jgi:hypothetical protein